MTIHTLHVECVMLMLIYTVITVANAWLYKGIKGIYWFAFYNFFSLLSATAVALRGNIPDFLSIVGGNLFFVIAYALLFLSLYALWGGKRYNLWLQAVLIAVATVGMVQWGVIHPKTSTRLIAYSVILLLQEAHICLFILRKADGTQRHVGRLLALMIAGLALANFVRVLGVMQLGAPSNYLQAGPFLAWIVMINSGLQCGVVVAYVWMTAALLRDDLEIRASTDPLTGLLNRRAMEAAADHQIALCAQGKSPISAILIDLDNFKDINDQLGHHHGDETLIGVAKVLAEGLRSDDLVARVGGDEFAIVLPRTSLHEARNLAEKLRVALQKIPFGPAQTTGVTASFGITQARPHVTNWDLFSIECDKVLYASKRRGGNALSSADSGRSTAAAALSTP